MFQTGRIVDTLSVDLPKARSDEGCDRTVLTPSPSHLRSATRQPLGQENRARSSPLAEQSCIESWLPANSKEVTTSPWPEASGETDPTCGANLTRRLCRRR